MKHLKQSFLLSALVLVNASAPGQNNAVYAWRNFAGQPGGSGNVDGTGSAARFYFPEAVAVDSAGNVYVADSANHAIRKVTSDGVVTTLAGSPQQSGSVDGTGSAARFGSPSGVAVDSAGVVYVADTSNHTIRKVTSTGVVTTMAGSAGQSGSTDGTNSAARFNHPWGVAVDSASNLYVADYYNHTIRQVTSDGEVTTLAGSAGVSGTNDATGSAAQFYYPAGVAVDSGGNLYVADSANYTIRKIACGGVVTTLAGSAGQSGSTEGMGSAARFNYPSGVALDNAGNVYVADDDNSSIRLVTSAGVVTTLPGCAARFANPRGVAVDGDGNVYVAEYRSHSISRVTRLGTVTTLAGSAPQFGSLEGTGNAARLHGPFGVALDCSNSVYLADYYNHTIRKVTSAGVVTTLAGSAGQSGSADGTNSAARFSFPEGVAVDSTGNVFVADFGNHIIRQVTSGGVVTTLAGSAGKSGSVDATGSAARFKNPAGVAVDGTGDVFVADYGNHTIRKVTSGGVVTTLAGSAGASGSANGIGNSARFYNPLAVAVDNAGTVYVADYINCTIRKVTSDRVVTTLTGSAGQPGSADGTGSTARFFRPTGLTLDSAGNLYVADDYNQTIRKVTSAGVVTTIGGTAGAIGGLDGVSCSAIFAYPWGIGVDSTGCLYVGDSANNRISRGSPLPVITINNWSDSGVMVSWPSSAAGFVLQQNANLANASGWQNSSYNITDDGTNRSITVTSLTESLFFRLVGY